MSFALPRRDFAMTTLAVRARVAGRPEPPFERLHDPLVAEVVQGGPLARARFATLWHDGAAISSLAAAKRAPLDPALADALRAYHRRLGAPPESLAALERLARGEATCAVAGQQPAPLGGPLFSLHKTASAVALAQVAASRTSTPCVPLYWMHGEDSDFAEIRGATVFDAALAVHDFALPDRWHREGGLVGDLPAAPVAEIHAQALAAWTGLPGHADAATLLGRAAAAARDLGELQSALMLGLFGAHGLVVVDPRLPEFRAAARPVIDRYLARADALGAAARDAGAALESRIGRRALADAALESFVFEVQDGVRRKVTPAEARQARGPLSPSVALRPVIQDAVFPTIAMACGSAEILYLAQLREVFEGLGVRPAAPVPRLTATWVPAAALALADAAGVTPWEVIAGADAVLRAHAEQAAPADARRALEQARVEANAGLERFAALAAQVEASLPQMVESARAKVDFQYARLADGLVGKVRHRIERQHPEWMRLRYVLLPGDKLQERRIATVQPIAHRGAAAAAELCEVAADHARRLAEGAHAHYVLELAP